MSCWAEWRLSVIFGGHRYSWAFLLADVQFNIIGVDFLQHFQLLVDVAAGGLRQALPATATVAAAVPADQQSSFQSSPSLPTVEAHPSTSLPTVEALELPSATAAARTPPTAAAKSDSHVKDILADFADVLNEEGRLPPSTHGVEHHIVTSGRPVTAKFRRLDNVKLVAAKAEFQLLEKEGIGYTDRI